MASTSHAGRVLLISNSTLHGSGSLDHAEKDIRNFVGTRNAVIFIPFAINDRKAYAAKAQGRLREMGLALTSVHDVSNMQRAIAEADVIFVGGGNRFRSQLARSLSCMHFWANDETVKLAKGLRTALDNTNSAK